MIEDKRKQLKSLLITYKNVGIDYLVSKTKFLEPVSLNQKGFEKNAINTTTLGINVVKVDHITTNHAEIVQLAQGVPNVVPSDITTNIRENTEVNSSVPTELADSKLFEINYSLVIKKVTQQLTEANTLEEVRVILNNFEACTLKKTANNTVFGVGNHSAEILFLGEAPGADEDLLGEPFVGRSGVLLTTALKDINLTRENSFITNTIFWRPPGNRNPTQSEIVLCTPFVKKIIEVVNPKIIIGVGKVSANYLLEEDTSISKLRSLWHERNFGFTNDKKCVLIRVIYHPAYLLRNPSQKKVFWFDLLEIKHKIKELGINL